MSLTMLCRLEQHRAGVPDDYGQPTTRATVADTALPCFIWHLNDGELRYDPTERYTSAIHRGFFQSKTQIMSNDIIDNVRRPSGEMLYDGRRFRVNTVNEYPTHKEALLVTVNP